MLNEILSIQSASYDQFRMFAYIIRKIQDIPNVSYYVDSGNIYITKGTADTYPCMVAHMDTVHEIVEDLHPMEIMGCITGFNRITMEQTGIGGDDKVGIYIAMQCLMTFDNIKVAFFRDEEVGCQGSYEANMIFFRDCRFVLQCDRKGNSDFITNASGIELSSKDFQDDISPIISKFGYSFAQGMMTDVMALKENGIKCSVANMSCGYYNPHMPNEFVDVHDVEHCLEMCKTIISSLTRTYKHKSKPRSWSKPSKKSKFHDWNAAKCVDPLWDDYYESYREKEIESRLNHENYCQDCWRDEAGKDGLCDTCRQWYKEHNDIF